MELICETGLHCNVFNAEFIYVVNGKNKAIRMETCSQGWKTELELPDGEYYYKFILNNGIRMNDPNAYSYAVGLNDEVWSVLKVVNGKNQKGNKIIPKLNKFIINNGKKLLYPRNRACYVSFDLNGVCGVHSITALWYQPDGSLYHIEETTIETPINLLYTLKETFWVDFEKDTHPFDFGTWMVEIYVDGVKSVREFFNVFSDEKIRNTRNYSFSL